MSAPRSRHRPRPHPRARQTRKSRRARRIAVLVLLASVLVPTLLLSAFGGGSNIPIAAAPALATRLAPAGPPQPQIVATLSALRLQMPVAQSQVTAVGYGGGTGGSLALSPVGEQANAGLLQRLWHKLVGNGSSGIRWYQLPGGRGGGSSSALDVGAAPGTDVYAPVDGTIVGISDLVLNGRPYGQQIEIQPATAPSLVVVVSHLRADPALTAHGVGSAVVAGSSKIGSLLDFSSVERQALAHYTQDAGNHVLVEVHPAATLSLP